MKKQLFSIMALCAAGLVLQAQAQSSSSGLSGSSSSATEPSSGSQSGWTGRHSGHGGMGQQEIKASQLTGAQVVSSSGTQLGTISDCIINPNSGRIEFAILSLSGGASGSTGSATSPSGSSTGSATSPSGSSLGSAGGSSSATSSSSGSASSAGASGKQVAVPWKLLRPENMSSSASSGAGQLTFTFNGEQSKLESAPSFDASTDLSQPSWKQSVFSYFGISGAGSATGGAESPGSTSGSSGSSSSLGTSGTGK
ncbi:MAG: PRC-barrel domain-containing protein [Candidatus Dormibacteraceae bacterium]